MEGKASRGEGLGEGAEGVARGGGRGRGVRMCGWEVPVLWGGFHLNGQAKSAWAGACEDDGRNEVLVRPRQRFPTVRFQCNGRHSPHSLCPCAIDVHYHMLRSSGSSLLRPFPAHRH